MSGYYSGVYYVPGSALGPGGTLLVNPGPLPVYQNTAYSLYAGADGRYVR